MKTVSILQYDHDGHQFFPSFVVHDDLQDSDTECAFDEVVINPSEEWMEDYLQWNRFSRLPDDPVIEDDEHLDCDHTAIPVFETLEELREFNQKGSELAEKLSSELAAGSNYRCCIQVAPFEPLYSDMAVGPLAAWWHVKDRNYGFVVPLQKLPISDALKARLQAFRFHKSMGLWKDPHTRHALRQEGLELEQLLLRELNADPTGNNSHDGTATMEDSKHHLVLPAPETSIEERLPCSPDSPRSVKHPGMPAHAIHAAME